MSISISFSCIQLYVQFRSRGTIAPHMGNGGRKGGGSKLHCQTGGGQASGGVDGAHSTLSISVTVGTTHPQRF